MGFQLALVLHFRRIERMATMSIHQVKESAVDEYL